MPITLNDFKEGGKLYKFVTQTGLLDKIGKEGTNEEELLEKLMMGVTASGVIAEMEKEEEEITPESGSGEDPTPEPEPEPEPDEIWGYRLYMYINEMYQEVGDTGKVKVIEKDDEWYTVQGLTGGATDITYKVKVEDMNTQTYIALYNEDGSQAISEQYNGAYYVRVDKDGEIPAPIDEEISVEPESGDGQ